MTTQKILYTVIGLIAGFFIGFVLANSLNRNAALQPAVAQNSSLPINNPSNPAAATSGSQNAAMMPEIAATLEKASQNPNDFEAQMKAGEIYLRIQQTEKAAEFFNRAATVYKDDFQQLSRLGGAFFDVRNFAEAEKYYLLALAKKPDDVDVRTDLASTFIERPNPDFDRAINEYQTSLKLNPKHENTLFNLAVAQIRKGDLESARQTAQEIEKLNPSSPLVGKLKERLDAPVTN